MHNLGVHFDICMTMTAHAGQLVRGCFYQLHWIKAIWKFIPTSATVILVNSFIVFRVCYCYSILAGLLTHQLEWMHSVINSSACLRYGQLPSDHVTGLLHDNLHWLCIPNGSPIRCA